MKNIPTTLPDTLLRQAQAIAAREQMLLDQFISLALASQVSVWDARAKQGDWQKAQEILAQAPNTEPEEFDSFVVFRNRATAFGTNIG
ncbi:MAG: hypothetical protein JST84_20720 [Acidobacteria bacterium]|nr:hypothetical protein [Acidobacteriota bacterium]